ncbi:MAG: ribosome-binding factor A [Gammaproteobacteria bacterium]|nr:ribosome-binding factor A [Gammaproteobacteria bacterium]
MSIRQQKASKQLKKSLCEYFILNNDQMDEIPSMTKISISKDLKNATVYIYVNESIEKTQSFCNSLNKKSYSINQFMIKHVQFRVLPKLKFTPDKEQREIDDIQKLLNKL